MHSELADDRAFPLMIWYGIEPAVAEAPPRALDLAGSSRLPRLVRFLARGRAKTSFREPEAGRPSRRTGQPIGPERTNGGHSTREWPKLCRGWRKAPKPPSWTSLQAAFSAVTHERLRRPMQELSVVFGDGRSLDQLFKLAQGTSVDLGVRRDALRILVEARFAKVVPLLERLANDQYLGLDAIHGSASFNDPAIPAFLLPVLVDPIRRAVRAGIDRANRCHTEFPSLVGAALLKRSPRARSSANKCTLFKSGRCRCFRTATSGGKSLPYGPN